MQKKNVSRSVIGEIICRVVIDQSGCWFFYHMTQLTAAFVDIYSFYVEYPVGIQIYITLKVSILKRKHLMLFEIQRFPCRLQCSGIKFRSHLFLTYFTLFSPTQIYKQPRRNNMIFSLDESLNVVLNNCGCRS